jgi:hypothetical protein
MVCGSLLRRLAGSSVTLAIAAVGAATMASDASAACSAPQQRGHTAVVHCLAVAREQAFVVPRGITSVRVTAVGAGGGFGGSILHPGAAGGAGAVAAADLRVRPGRKLYVLVGGLGATRDDFTLAPGGFNGGGSGGATPGLHPVDALAFPAGSGGGGGGASDVRTCSVRHHGCDPRTSRLIAAAGGGGGGGSSSVELARGGAGGAGGARGSGAPGTTGSVGAVASTGGAGATRRAGGAAGGSGARAGRRGTGGAGATSAPLAGNAVFGGGGGGGGGLFGGGGGSTGGQDSHGGGGGGGGSSFGPTGATFGLATAVAPGSVTIAWVRRG